MVVISDLHLGNPFSKARRKVAHFIRWAAAQGYDICINGDGLEIAQASFDRVMYEVPEFFRIIAEIRRRGREVYYVIGNHDIALEHFLEDWGVMKVSPFLNVHSGESRVRIEHGHIYDPFFVKYPRLYEALTNFGGLFLKVHPQLYRLWINFEKFKSKLRAKRQGIVGEHPSFREAAFELSRRGFDSIVFGHTHHPGELTLETGGKYFNPGSWMLSTHYVEIDKGQVNLKSWEEM
ncbi:MAG: UDP-2,3-diacylglucosamine diphosphatase [Bdellovibrionales bacterium]|nr:UDP-2,3-diacylglucosamine diphosphatase [Bdellovibrionales bacterium]